jgi:hypothetical protein
MTPQNPAPTAAPQKKRGPLVIILVVVGVLVVAGVAVAAWKLSSSSSSSRSGAPAGQTAKGLYKAWQSGNQAAAAKDATPTAVTDIFKVTPTDASGLQFDRCSATGSNPFPKECTWSRPGGQLTMTVQKQGGKPKVTKVEYGPAATTPTG